MATQKIAQIQVTTKDREFMRNNVLGAGLIAFQNDAIRLQYVLADGEVIIMRRDGQDWLADYPDSNAEIGDPQAVEIAMAEAQYQLEERFFPDRQVIPTWYMEHWGLGEDAAKDASHWNPWYLHHLWKQGKKPPLAEKYNEEVTQALKRLPSQLVAAS